MTKERDIYALLEDSLDGRLDRDEQIELEARMKEDPRLAAHQQSVNELRGLLRSRFDNVANSVDFARIQDNVMDAVEDTSAVREQAAEPRSSEMEMMAMAWADGELRDEQDRQEVLAYLERQPEAKSAAEGLSELRDLTRMPFERAQESIDFDALSHRVMDAIEEEDQATAKTESAAASRSRSSASFAETVLTWLKAPGTGAAAFVGAAVAVAILLPMLLQNGTTSEQPQQVVNHYYMGAPEVESVRYDEGYWGSMSPGDDMSAPVIWIQQEEAAEDPNTEEDATLSTEPSDPDRGI
jgi:anti-sigma factor RsiW